MFPSLLTRDIRNGLKQYLMTAYESSDGFFRGVMERFLERDGAWMKGPYVQIGLPFRAGARGRDFFEGFQTIHPGFTHQEAAWERLKGEGSAANTLVATGTGSGKTECFLYPLLEHCARVSAAGVHGIKALILYPMNALATDQARRIAEMIRGIPAFKNVRAGLYVGGVTSAGGGTIMTPTSVITDRETMRDNPPDILLTNYKMLDYLLLRPRDRDLWAKNEPDTLRYIVVDELHTFDGAQGTDLALLLRRIKARLKVPKDVIAHIGTSATLGSSPDTEPLRCYAQQVFGSPFTPECLITEDRLNVSEFLGDESATFLLEARPNLAESLMAATYLSMEEMVAAWFALFFPVEPAPEDVNDSLWRQRLGSLLKRHSLFAALLKALQAGSTPASDIEMSLANQVTVSIRPYLGEVLDALLVLVAWARSSENATSPFVTLRIQTWLRELRRMVAPLTAVSAEVEIKAASDLKKDSDRIHLPLIQCAECHTTAWLSRVSNLGENKLSAVPEEIYNGWFSGAVETVRLYPLVDVLRAKTEGIEQFACVSCGALNAKEGECAACGGPQLVRVFRPTGQKKATRGNSTRLYHDKTCPACGAPDAMVLIGSRSTTLSAQIVERSWGSPYNDDRKLIAFSDSVQDAAHRAGFISARTYIHTVRNALARGVHYLVKGATPWSEFKKRFEVLWQDHDGPLHMDAARFVSEFIGPNMTWQRDWTDLYHDDGRLKPDSPLIARVQKRLVWQAYAEFTYAGNRGRNLDRLGVATLAPLTSDIDAAAVSLQSVLRERFGIDASQLEVFRWLWGMVIHLRQRGAIFDTSILGTYPKDGNLFNLTKTKERLVWMPNMGTRTIHPVFLAFGVPPQKMQFDRVVNGSSAWYSQWLDAILMHDNVLQLQDRIDIHHAAVDALEAAGVVKTLVQEKFTSVGLNPDRMYLFTDVLRMKSDAGTRGITVPEETATQLIGMPCLDAHKESYASKEKPDSDVVNRLRLSALRRVISAEHTGLLEREERESLEKRFKSRKPEPWYENLLSATPTLEMGVDIGDLSSVMLCAVPPTVASYLQRVGRAGRRDGNSYASTLADGASPHDLYFYEEPSEMISGEVISPGIFLQAPEVLRRQYCAFCLDDWVAGSDNALPLPDKTDAALNAIDTADQTRFPYSFLDHIQKNRPRLFDAFIELLGENADEAVVSRLRLFVVGSEEDSSLHYRLLEALTDISVERKNYSARVKDLRLRIKDLKSKPKDEAIKEEIAGLEQEEGKFQDLIAEINGRELLNTLTDAGLIPNYAFPEAGVVLKSVLWRHSTEEDKTSRKSISLGAMRYERPASSALSEFAPENRFYANQRRVVVDQINMDMAKLENWRLCPNCNHMENLEITADAESVCPRCQDPMWSDNAQKRLLLRFRQAIANSDDVTVRIDDSVEEREPRFYTRQMLVDFSPDDIQEAWMLKSDLKPFGFEFIASACFRDINFGESGKSGERFKVADSEQQRPGFKLCRFCGVVQTEPGQEDEKETQKHAFDCPAKKDSNTGNILQCLYLYREFHSEALRILVPFTRLGVDDSVVQSFSAAFQLGLKRQFGGRVDHLRVMVQESPDPDDGPRRYYLLVYDSVPGGTGYLRQLLAHDARTLKGVFQKALDVLEACPCRNDPEKDGCYRCVYQYRLGRNMHLVSRCIALSVMRDLVESLDTLERTTTISGIGLNRAMDSALESRFIESLSRLSKSGEIPRVTLIREIVNGREGYHLQAGENRYTIEMQTDLNHEEGVKRASRPDFIIRPLSATSKRKPIAVFCDGWTYHKDIIRDDAAKRTAILNSGKYWVWSVVMEDVEAAIGCKPEQNLPSPYKKKTNRPDMSIPSEYRSAEPSTFTLNAVAELLRRLAEDEEKWVTNAWAACMGWLMRLVPDKDSYALIVQANTELRSRLPMWLPDPPEKAIDVALAGDGLFNIHGMWSQFIHQAEQKTERAPNVIRFDDISSVQESERHTEWRWWLWAFNWFQAIPGAMLVTRSGVVAGDYAALNPVGAADTRISDGSIKAEGPGWEEAFEQMLSTLVDEARNLAAQNCPPPDEIGYSLINDEEEELSMAELVWMDQKTALLTAEYAQDRETWETFGWNIIIAEPDWASRIKSTLSESGEVNG